MSGSCTSTECTQQRSTSGDDISNYASPEDDNECEAETHYSSDTSSSDILAPVPSPLSFSSSDSLDSAEESSSDSSIDIDTIFGPESLPVTPSAHTYKLVGDNIDKNVRPRHMTSENQIHYFHTFAVQDRVDLSSFSKDYQLPDTETLQLDNYITNIK